MGFWTGVLFSKDTATFANYFHRIQKVCFPISSSTTWFTPAVRHLAKGARKVQDKSFRFPNFIRAHLRMSIVARETLASEFAQV